MTRNAMRDAATVSRHPLGFVVFIIQRVKELGPGRSAGGVDDAKGQNVQKFCACDAQLRNELSQEGDMMAARLDSVAKFICERGGWKVTNLQIQKIIYLIQMFYMGQNDGSRLVDAGFEAWDYGPVVPRLYRKVRMFGARPIEDVFYDARPFKTDDPRRALMESASEQLLPLKPGELVDITHWTNGAWAKNYVPGIKGIGIPDNDIVAEYRARREGEK
jgi:uncharacterized phage-associated protein